MWFSLRPDLSSKGSSTDQQQNNKMLSRTGSSVPSTKRLSFSVLTLSLFLLALSHTSSAIRASFTNDNDLAVEGIEDAGTSTRNLLLAGHKKAAAMQYHHQSPPPAQPPPPQQVAAAPAPAPNVAQPSEAAAPIIAYSQAIAMSSPSPTEYIAPPPPQQVAAAPAPAPPPPPPQDKKPTVVVIPSPPSEPSCPYGKKLLLCKFLGY